MGKLHLINKKGLWEKIKKKLLHSKKNLNINMLIDNTAFPTTEIIKIFFQTSKMTSL